MTINTKRSADALANASGGIYTNSNNLPVDWSASVFQKLLIHSLRVLLI
jgi:hypothetical protein